MLFMAVRRLMLAFPTLLALTGLLFFSVTNILGTPATMMLGEDASQARSPNSMHATCSTGRPMFNILTG